MYCPNCGAEVTTKFCPNCGAAITPQARPQQVQQARQQQSTYMQPKYICPPKNKSNRGKTALTVILCIFGFAALMGILFGEEEPSNDMDNLNSYLSTSSAINNSKQDVASKDDVAVENSSKPVESTKKETTYEQDRQLVAFNGVKATFMEVYDPEIGVTALFVKLKLENNGSEEVTVLPVDGYVNDTAVQFMSGLPVTIAPGKNAVGVYSFGYNDLGFSKVEDIEKMEFKLGLMSSDWSGVKKSEVITMNF